MTLEEIRERIRQDKADFENSILQKRAAGQLSPGAIQGQFEGMRESFAPLMSIIQQQNAMAASQAARGAQAGLLRGGLGNTGLGTALGAGLMQGATNQTNALRARLEQDLYGSAIGIQGQRAGLDMSFLTAQMQVQAQREAARMAAEAAQPHGFQKFASYAGPALQGASLFSPASAGSMTMSQAGARNAQIATNYGMSMGMQSAYDGGFFATGYRPY